MKREDIEDIYPLSPLQEGILFQVRGAPDRSDYVSRTAWDVRGSFDPDRFRDVWHQLLKRHPILRTGFSWRHSATPVQIVFKQAVPAGRTLDWRSKEHPEQFFEWWLESDLKRGFDLGKPPLMRLTLIRFSDDHWRLVWTRHHLLLDGWSGALLLREAFQLYLGQPLGAPPPTFRKYIGWLKEKQDRASESWWRKQLHGFNTATPIGPLKHQPQQGKRVEVELTLTLDALPPGLTQSTLVQAAWALRLARFAGLQDVLFGCTVAGRSPELPGSEKMIGLFINTLPLRVQLDPQAKVSEWLKQLQLQMAALRDHEHNALSQIRTYSDVPSGQPFFHSIVVFENYPSDRSLTNGHHLDIALSFRDERTHYPLALYALPGDSGLTLRLCYDSGYIENQRALEMLQHVAEILQQLQAHHAQRLEDLRLLSPQQSQEQIKSWNHTAENFAGPQTLVELLDAQRERTPETVAVEFGQVKLTFSELHQRADQVAAQLRALHLPAETRIGVALPRSEQMVLALLGILKAGLSYIPLDPKFPTDRLSYIVEDSQVAFVFSSQNYPWLPPEKILRLQAGAREATASKQVIFAEQRAYTIYTSGSTGRPKGVDIPHAAVVNFLRSMAQNPGLTSGDRLLALTTLSFDISVLEIFLPLCVGATLVVADEESATDPLVLGQVLEHVSHAQATPATWNMLYASGWRGQPQLEVWSGGEALPQTLADQLTRDNAKLWNLYGPTETTIWSAIREVAPGDPVTLGLPIANTAIHVLDGALRAQPIGFVGEIWIAGHGLARGYHQRPDLTAERFIPDPQGNGERLYRTGDLGMRCGDGQLRFVGRVDHQVKVRGFRIETGEIEHALRQHERIHDAVVLVAQADAADAVLVAFVRCKDASEATANWRAYLAKSLPEYMIPSYFEVCRDYPLTPNGKIDRKTLMARWQSQAACETETAAMTLAPRDAREAAVLQLVQRVLNKTGVCITKSFFELGGHSLQATRLLALMRKELALHVPLQAFFEQPTVAALAAAAKPFNKLPVISVDANRHRFPLSSTQRRFLFLHRFEAQSSAYHIATSVRIAGPLNTNCLAEAFDKLQLRHEILRTTYTDDMQCVHETWLAKVEQLDVQTMPPDLQQEKVQSLIAQPFDLSVNAPIRLHCLQLSAQSYNIILVAHHIAVDAQSLEIAVRDLIAFYREAGESIPANLPELPIQYGDYAAWLAGQEQQAAKAFWAKQLHDLPTMPLPTDFPRPTLQTFNGGRVEFDIPNLLYLKQFSEHRGVSLYVCLLALFKLQLAQWCQSRDVVVGTPVSGRERDETQAMLGCFINNLVMRTRLEERMTFHELLERVRITAQSAFGQQGLAFEEMLELVPVARDLSRAPLFQVLFNFRVDTLNAPSVHALSWQAAPLADNTAKYDISLIVRLRQTRLEAAIEYNTDLFDERSMITLRDNLIKTVEQVTHKPDRVLELNQQHLEKSEDTLMPAAGVAGRYPKQEALLLALFREVLGNDFPSVDDNFFEHGGHSLRAVQLLTRLRTEHFKIIPLKTFFLNPTPAALVPFLLDAARPDLGEPFPERPDQLQLSPTQSRLWLADQLDPHAAAYNMPSAVRLSGNLDLAALKQSVQHVVQRHEILRTRFPEESGQPYQEILATYVVPFDVFELEGESELLVTLRHWVATPFDLKQAPPIRLALMYLGSEDAVLAINLHHIIADDWGHALAVQEVMQFYNQLCSEGHIAPEPLPSQYADLALWQQGWLKSPAAEQQRQFWTEQLADCEPLRLPMAKQVGKEDSLAGDQIRFEIDAEQTKKLEALAESQGVTAYVVYLSLWQSLLARVSHSREMRVGTSVAGRHHRKSETALGSFVNTVILRTPIEVGLSFEDLLQRNKAVLADALDNSQLPFEEVQQRLPKALREQLFPAFFVLHTAGETIDTSTSPSGLRATPVELPLPGARFGLSLSLKRDERGLLGSLSYRNARFAQNDIAQLLQSFLAISHAVLAAPERQVDRLPILNAQARKAVMTHSLNPSAMAHALPVMAQVGQQAHLTPNHIALKDGDTELTYAVMWQRVSATARRLIQQGIEPEEVVAIAARRQCSTVVAMLAVQAVGAVALPLEVDTPPKRLAFMADETQVRFCLVGHQDQAFGADLWQTLEIAIQGANLFEPQVASESLAYLIYTSGSTGTPKAVAISHHALAAYVAAISQKLQPKQSQQWMMVTTLAADLGFTCLFPALVSGGTVHIMPRETVLDASAIATEIAERDIDILKCTPSWFRALLETDFPEMALPQHALLLGGEACDPELIAKIQGLSSVQLFNHYGPSESTVGIVVQALSHITPGRVPIGQPLAGAKAFVLDAQLQLLPPGVPGQLYVGGPQLARGYFARPDLTADRFIPDPFATGERLYQTGDWVVRNHDGSLVFLRRMDHQLKLRGYRIELAEIEAVLQQRVEQAVVLVKEDAGTPYLHAFVTGDFPEGELKQHLQAHLPDYMQPSRLQQLQQMPLSQNGKVDRKALAKLAEQPAGEIAPFETPRTEAEKILAGIWSRLLNKEQIGVNDDFFQLGGDSIVAIQAIVQMRAHGFTPSPASFFGKPTLAEQAKTHGEQPSQAPRAALQTQQQIPLTPIQKWFFQTHGEHQPAHFNQAIMLNLKQELAPQQLRAALESLIQHHQVFGLRFQQRDHEWLQLASLEATLHFEVFNLRNSSAAEIKDAIENHAAQAQQDFDLQTGELHRVVLYQTPSEHPDRLFIACHHLLVDGVSWRLLLQDLEQLLQGNSLMAPPATFAQTANALLRRLPHFRKQIDFWKQQCHTAEIPCDKDCGPNHEASTQSHSVSLSEGISREILAANQHHIHVYLLAALVQTFAKTCEISDLSIHLEGYGRDETALDLDASQTVGWLTSVYPVMLNAKAHAGELLQHVAAQLDAITENGISHGALRYLDTAQPLWDLQQPQLIFNYLGQFDAVLQHSAYFAAAEERGGLTHAPQQIRQHLIDINASVLNGRLRVAWRYSLNRFEPETIARWADTYMASLERLMTFQRTTRLQEVRA